MTGDIIPESGGEIIPEQVGDFDRNQRYTGLAAERLKEPLVYDAVLRNLQTLSEASQRLPDSIKSRHPKIPWLQIGRFRNILVHDYLGDIDSEIIWRVIQRELPALKSAVERELPGGPAAKS